MPELLDSFDRRINYLRVSVTDRCNYRCFYCIPSNDFVLEERREFLSYEELTRLIRLFAELGVSHVRLTGGEPLVRRGLVEWVDQLKRLPGIEEISLSSNAHLLAEHAADLKAAGLDRVNISLDSLKPETFLQVTRNGDLERVLAGIDAALEAQLHPVKLNMVVMKGLNDQEIEPMLDYALERGANLRFIETMPIGRAGLDGIEHYYPASTILERVKSHMGAELIPATTDKGAGPARYYRISGSRATVGVISAMSRHFCDGCNRVRLTARGELVLCLGQEDRASLREPLRDGADDQELKQHILAAIARKPKNHDFNEDPLKVATRTMSSLGG